MYDYRSMSRDERQRVVALRRQRGLPLHAPPHDSRSKGTHLITAACFEHRPIFQLPDDLTWLTGEVLSDLAAAGFRHWGWVFLPNHYHLLLDVDDMQRLQARIRLLHSRLATTINSRHGTRGRRVWYRFSDREIRSQRHFGATLNYLFFNPVRHDYVTRMLDWPWSSVHEALEISGMAWMQKTWNAYPIQRYGQKAWDP